jgi:transcriptional regulator with XRE-family HTH domain
LVRRHKISYSEVIRTRAKLRKITRRDLESALGCSYEHVRKIWAGETLPSAELNEKLSTVLSLDAGEMWDTANAERMETKFGKFLRARAARPNEEIIEVWHKLSSSQRRILLDVANAMVEGT